MVCLLIGCVTGIMRPYDMRDYLNKFKCWSHIFNGHIFCHHISCRCPSIYWYQAISRHGDKYKVKHDIFKDCCYYCLLQTCFKWLDATTRISEISHALFAPKSQIFLVWSNVIVNNSNFDNVWNFFIAYNKIISISTIFQTYAYCKTLANKHQIKCEWLNSYPSNNNAKMYTLAQKSRLVDFCGERLCISNTLSS